MGWCKDATRVIEREFAALRSSDPREVAALSVEHIKSLDKVRMGIASGLRYVPHLRSLIRPVERHAFRLIHSPECGLDDDTQECLRRLEATTNRASHQLLAIRK